LIFSIPRGLRTSSSTSRTGSWSPSAAVEIPQAREIVPNVNRISAAVRAAGGLNVFIRYLVDDTAIVQWSN
jgi:ureidoacrylate peracid hydrolase